MNDWDAADSGLLAGLFSGFYADSESTKRLISRGGKETNPLLGTNPSGEDLDRAAFLSAVVGTGAAAALPKEWRRPVIGALAGLEHGMAYKNDRTNPKAKETDFVHSGLEGPLMTAALGGLIGYAMNQDDSGIGASFDRVRDDKGRFASSIKLTFDQKF